MTDFAYSPSGVLIRPGEDLPWWPPWLLRLDRRENTDPTGGNSAYPALAVIPHHDIRFEVKLRCFALRKRFSSVHESYSKQFVSKAYQVSIL